MSLKHCAHNCFKKIYLLIILPITKNKITKRFLAYYIFTLSLSDREKHFCFVKICIRSITK